MSDTERATYLGKIDSLMRLICMLKLLGIKSANPSSVWDEWERYLYELSKEFAVS
jgi:hypothetical protein